MCTDIGANLEEATKMSNTKQEQDGNDVRLETIERLTPKVTEKKILDQGKNIYQVCWSRCANFGYDLIRADSEQEAFDKHLYSGNKEVNFIITKVSKNNLPLIFKQKGD